VILDGGSYELRLTSSQLDKYIDKFFKGDVPPLPGVLQAIDHVAMRNDLLGRALHYPGSGAPRDLTGADFVDLLVDDGFKPETIAMMIVDLADLCGIVPEGMKEDLKTAATKGEQGVIGQANQIVQAISGELTAEDGKAPETAKEAATPTK
jgi:hypothetical protein